MPDLFRIFRSCFFCHRKEVLTHSGPPYYSYHHECLSRALRSPEQRIRNIANQILSAQQEQISLEQQVDERRTRARADLLSDISSILENSRNLGVRTSDFGWSTTTVTTRPIESVGIGTSGWSDSSTPYLSVEITKTPIFENKNLKEKCKQKKTDKHNKMRKIFGD